ncbi:MAG: hypothetical protein SH817_07445 [Leptospira sp.]|nr:hypothetical protein [Leptospira sp.]
MEAYPTFNDKFSHLLHCNDGEIILSIFNQILNEVPIKKDIDELLKNGILLAILKSILTLMQREINPTSKEILGEYQYLINEIEEVYFKLNPTNESNWLEECIAYGDKKAYHWEWKHFGSKELF